MTSPSNLYAEKVFAEHPTALWALDDPVDYVSLVNDIDRDLTAWSISGGTSEISLDTYNQPLPESQTTKVYGDIVTEFSFVELISPDIIDLNELNTTLETFSIGTYFNSQSIFIGQVQIGYRYFDAATSQWILKEDTPLEQFPTVKTINLEISNNWVYISETFTPPVDNGLIQIIIRIGYLPGATSTEENEFLLNGLTMGQWAEEFSAESLGVQKVAFPSNIALTATDAVRADAYGLIDTPGYYLINDNSLTARNTGIPMIYGSENVTTLYPNGASPSVIIPGFGFLNQSGQYRDYTAEMWLRINADTDEYRKIFGPISSDDGLYVKGPFLMLKIGTALGSHFVGEWSRPMLVQIEMIRDSASLIINGEQVMTLDFLTSELILPAEFNSEDKSQDWLGFYAYDDVSPIDIDCVAIYSYQVPSIVSKRRWVFGQGVDFPENINTSYSGTSVVIDYPFADYTNNYNYPDIGSWNQAFIDNALTTNDELTSPTYTTPLPQFSTKTVDSWYEDSLVIQNEQEPFIKLIPNSNWDNEHGHLLFSDISFLQETARSIYAVFKETSAWSEDQVLIHIVDDLNGNYFEVVNKETTTDYILKYGGSTQTLRSVDKVSFGDKFVAGIDVRRFSSSLGGNVEAFFGRSVSLDAYFGGRPDFSQSFSGNIYNINFDTPRNTTFISSTFDINGVATQIPEDHDASYSAVPVVRFGKYELTYKTKSYWEDYVPLTYLGQYVLDENNQQYYDIDFIQLNINYPASAINDDGCFTQNDLVRTYISFQYLESGANASQQSFSNTVCAPTNGVVKPGAEWLESKYEVTSGNLIYPPDNVDFNNIAIVVHIEMKTTDSTYEPIRIRTLQLASQAFNDSSPNSIGTRFGVPIFPYKKSGVYFDYKTENPYSIYKGSTPYLYLTRTSGIEVKGRFDENISRGLSIPINRNLAENYRIIAMQAAMRYDQDLFPAERTELFEVESRNVYLKFYLEPVGSGRKRARIIAVNARTNSIENGIGFYLNGKIVSNPVLSVKQWALVGISFANILNLDSFVGAIRLTGPMLFNTISHYQSTNLQQVQNTSFRNWLRVKFLGTSLLEWNFWASGFNWDGVLVLSATSYYGVDPKNIYKTYTGTNRVAVDDPRLFRLSGYEYVAQNDILWSTSTITPV